MTDTESERLMSLFRLSRSARAPMPADAAALGYMPLSAFQHCEAMRVASGYGTYVFPPCDIQLRFDGYQTFVAADGRWQELRHVPLDDESLRLWNDACPPEMADKAPNLLSSLPEPGVVQVWSGFFIQTAPGWATHMRPLANIHTRRDVTVFEAIVETDVFAPCPLFINIALRATDQEIIIVEEFPLFQIQPVPKTAFQKSKSDGAQVLDIAEQDFNWDAAKHTLRIPGVSEDRPTAGQYGATIRRARKQQS